MPELPEAEITRKKLEPLVGKRIIEFWSDWSRGLRVAGSAKVVDADIKGRRILKLWRHGKALFFGLSGGRILGFHQRMSGRLRTVRHSKGVMAGSDGTGHIHNKVFFSGGVELWFADPRKFGIVWYGPEDAVRRDKYIASLGPDGLSISRSEFRERLVKHSGMIKPVLLRQDVVAGIGNIVCDEMLWDAKIYPERALSAFGHSEVVQLHISLKKILKRGIKAQGSTLRDWGHPDGESGKFQKYFKVYGRGGERCLRCKNKIIRIVVGGRGTWVCERCQI